MSGIYGLSFCSASRDLLEKSADYMHKWTAFYGNGSENQQILEHSALGCHIEHFSNDFPAGDPVMQFDNYIAVIDSLIYNRAELLEKLGRCIDDMISDEALLIQWIQSKGFDALSQVNGDFAGAFYDAFAKEWILFRDHMGVRPLYYYLDSQLFAFATDLRALLALPEANTAISESALFNRTMGYLDLSLTGTDYRNIQCIRPASYTTVKITPSEFCVTEHVYWKLKQKKIRFRSFEEYKLHLRELVTDAVKRRLDAVPGLIGAELSGGLDSGVVDILINRLGREGRYYSWSWGPEEIPIRDGDDERKIIYDICQQENISCIFAVRNMHSVVQEYLDTVSPPYINTQNLSEGSAVLKELGANVVFTGHGGDEGISHRCDAYELLHNREYFYYVKLFWNSTKGCKLRILRTCKRAFSFAIRESKYYTMPYENSYSNSRMILKQEFIDRTKEKKVEMPLYFSFEPAKYVEQGGTRVRLDNVAYHGAINGVRYMIPFVDYRVMDFAVSIPRHLYINGKTNRYIYREAFRDILPESLYKMQYKDTSSLRDFKPDESLRNNFKVSMDFIVERLDKTYWGDILDFAAIEELALPEKYSLSQYRRMALVRHELLRCLLIQNAAQNAGKWCETHV